MKKNLLVSLLTGLCLFGMVGTVHAAIINFEDCSTNTFLDGSSYMGFNWGGAGYSWNGHFYDSNNWAIPSESDSITGFLGDTAHLGDKYAVNSAGVDIYFSDDSPFDINSVWIRHGGGNHVLSSTITGYLNSVEIYSKIFLATQEYQLLSLNFLSVDKITFSGNGHNLLLDDITFNESSPVPTPEPSTIILLASGILGLVGSRRKLKK